MKKDFFEYVDELTAPGQLFEYEEIKHKSGITYKEFKSAPKTLKDYFEFGLLFPDQDWLVYQEERYTFKDIYSKAAQTAHALKSAGVQKGDRVSVCMPNNPEYIIIYIAVVSMGAVLVPLNSWWVPVEIIYALKDSSSKIIIGDEKRLEGLDEIKDLKKIFVRSNKNQPSFNNFINNQPDTWPEVTIDPDDHATIFYTSGSTGNPKGVLSSHRNVLATLFSWALFFSIRVAREVDSDSDQTATDHPQSILHCVPLFHVTGSHAGFLMSVISGRKMILIPKWDVLEAMKLIAKEKITSITGVPTQTWDILNHPDRDKYDLSSLKDLSGGGAPRPPEHVKRLNDEMAGTPSIGYGLTETNALGTLNADDDYLEHPSSCGRAVPPITELAISDQDWNFLPDGNVGEVLIKSPANMIGYWNNDKATKEVFNSDGWFRSGDLGYIQDGFLFIVDRVKDLVIRGGENISCIEVESAIAEHKLVREVAVFGIPDERLGEILCAAIYAHDSAKLSSDEIQEFLKDKLAKFQIPENVAIQFEPLPRIASGKFSKPFLRDQFVNNLKN
tara:strand:- start:27964 stop:29637 length:1674 start_codon:yes stop_codon:yes gene_type:complete